MARAALLERIVEDRVGQPLGGTVSVAIDKLAEEIAREALSDDTFRRAIRELVRVRSEELLDQLLRSGNGKSAKNRRTSPKGRRSIATRKRP